MQPTPCEKATLINRYSPNKSDCQSGLPADPTSPIQGFNRSRGDSVGSGESKEPLVLTPREVAESPSSLPQAIHGFFVLT
ncbi:hypothetical protein CRG98_015554 [Punica granatum]|uniref:Uncharacterized protein n=1 Tax=Punica granatum TaxID=22663 RepID=A0A2I0K634_PUNGR|nr:hypothetical protein CRG98_015554 [Punica granatum]